MTARPIPFAHSAEDVERTICYDKQAWRAGFIGIESHSMGKFKAAVTWNAQRDAYTVDSYDEQVSRWVGFKVGETDRLEVGWHATAAIGKRWVAQFFVCGRVGEAA